MTAGVDHEYEDVYSNKIAAVLFDLVRSLDDTCTVTEPEHLHAGR